MTRRTATGLLVALVLPRVAAAALEVGTTSVEFKGKPGERGLQRITLTNKGPEPVVAGIELVDYWYGADGGPAFPPPGSTPRSAVAWIAPPPRAVELAPGQSASLDCAVTLPVDVTPGSYFAGFLVTPEGKARASAKVSARAKVDAVATLVANIGIKVVIHVHDANGEADAGQLALTDVRVLPPTPSTPLVVKALLSNPSTVLVRPDGRLAVVNAAGAFVGIGQFAGVALLPGASRWVEASLAVPLPPGSYSALIGFDAGNAGFLQQDVGFVVVPGDSRPKPAPIRRLPPATGPGTGK